MKIGYLHGRSPLNRDLIPELTRRLAPQHQLLAWNSADPAPASDFEVIVAQGVVSREAMRSQPRLRLIQMVSAGYDGVDVDAANELGIPVAAAPSDRTGNAISVAEWAIALMLTASRDLNRMLRSVHDRSVEVPVFAWALSGKTVCIAGFGRIGRLIAERLHAFGMRIVATVGRNSDVPAYVQAFPANQLAAATAQADFVVLCMRADKENEGLFDARALHAMKRGAVLINIARGSLVDEAALAAAIRSGQISAAGLDVLQHEPAPADDPLLALPQVLVTPHIAGATDIMLEGTLAYVNDAIDAFVRGEEPACVVNQPRALHALMQ